MNEAKPGDQLPPLAGLSVVEMGSGIAAPYLTKLLIDCGASVLKVESPQGDPYRQRPQRGADGTDEDSAWFRYLNAGKSSAVIDLEHSSGRAELSSLIENADLVLDDHPPSEARRLKVQPPQLRQMNPAAVIATLTSFGVNGPWANRPASEFTLQAMVGSTASRGVPGEEPVAVGGELGDFVMAAFAAPAILATALASQRSGQGVHLDFSQYEAMMHAFQTYRPIFAAFAPEHRPDAQIEIPSIEPAADGLVGFCCITGQQWQDFCAMIGAPDWAEDESLRTFEGRMARRDELWERIRAFTRRHRVDELVELAVAFRIPVGPVGTGDVVAKIDQFAQRGVFVDNPHGFIQPRPPYQFSRSTLAPLRRAPRLGESVDRQPAALEASLQGAMNKPLDGVRIVDLSAFWAGPIAVNLLRVLGAEVIKVESHVRLDGMRWASGLQRDQLWEFSPVYHGANVGKTVVNLDLETERGRAVLRELIASSDLVFENFSPRVVEQWGFGWDDIVAIDPSISLVRVPAFGLDGPWRDRVGFAMTMEQVSGLANRTGHADGPLLVPRGPVDTIAGMHAAFAAVVALSQRDRLGVGQLVEVPLIEGALAVAAEQVIEWSAYGEVLGRIGNRSMLATPQGLYRSADEQWVAISVRTDDEFEALCNVVTGAADLDRHRDLEALDDVLGVFVGSRFAGDSVELLIAEGVAAAVCIHANDSAATAQHDARSFVQPIEHSVAGTVPYLGFPMQIDGEIYPLGDPAPTLGQHSAEVLASLGLDEAEIGDLWTQGITGDWPEGVPRR